MLDKTDAFVLKEPSIFLLNWIIMGIILPGDEHKQPNNGWTFPIYKLRLSVMLHVSLFMLQSAGVQTQVRVQVQRYAN